MAGTKGQAPKLRKRVDAAVELKRAADGSGFVRCEECKKDVPVAVADMHTCSSLKVPLRVSSAPERKPMEKQSKKRSGGKTEEKKPKKQAKKRKKDSNLPKKPMTAFFLFMEDFRQKKKAENVKGSEVAKLGGEAWKAMTQEEKAPYTEKAAQLKREYDAEVKKLNADEASEPKEDDGGESGREDCRVMNEENADESEKENGSGSATEAEE
ncbi:high mobility group B protein 7-like [Selaginella moellendorffii]|uniref:high mobility group B protein 7-like n=1 Tax=Selaginella moellendorffii TaxID=88036 RepID=UPI000D1CBC09|nr:high mobility group B protein 7-like [Selaginella moellendorffii]|eukprot:XP_024543230.1 high mobility group B protein 7-like [Selaginella moellendorffii]